MVQVTTMTTLKTKRDETWQKGDERRQYPRNHLMLGVKCMTTVEEANDTPLEFHGHTTDVSLHGLCISADRNPGVRIGQQLKVAIQLFQGEAPIEAIGNVCWFKKADQAGEHSTQIGLELFGMANSIREFDRWIERITWD